MLKVSVISPEATLFEGEAASVTAPAFDGEVGILPQHAPMVTVLGTGELRIGDGTARFRVEGGFLQVVDEPLPLPAPVNEAADDMLPETMRDEDDLPPPVREIPVPGSDVPGEKTWPTQPRPVAPPPLARQGFTEADITNRTPEATRAVRDQLAKLKWGRSHIPPSVQGTVVSPGFHGGATWSGASYDPDRGLLYLNTNDVPYISVLRPNAAGGYDFGGYTYFSDHEGYPAQRPPWGWLNAVDVAKGRIAWRIPFGAYPELERSGLKGLGAQSFGGTIVTGGGLVFIGGSPDEKFRAYDADTGKELWSHPLPAGGYATPCTYMVGGKQYVVIAAGGGGKLGTRSSDTYVAFALP